MQTIPFTVDGSPHITPNLSRKSSVFRVSNGSNKRAHVSSDNVSFAYICCLYYSVFCFIFFGLILVNMCSFINLGDFSSYLYWF